MVLATFEKTVLAFVPISRIVPTTITRITASITAYSAMSCPSSFFHRLSMIGFMDPPELRTGASSSLYVESSRKLEEYCNNSASRANGDGTLGWESCYDGSELCNQWQAI